MVAYNAYLARLTDEAQGARPVGRVQLRGPSNKIKKFQQTRSVHTLEWSSTTG